MPYKSVVKKRAASRKHMASKREKLRAEAEALLPPALSRDEVKRLEWERRNPNDVRLQLEALKQHIRWIGTATGDVTARQDRSEGRLEEFFGLLGQLADQNALLRDALARERWRTDQLETVMAGLRAVTAPYAVEQDLEHLLEEL